MNIFNLLSVKKIKNSKSEIMNRNDILDCYWDFEINPISFDIAWMLSAATLYANNNGFKSIRVNFIPEKNTLQRNYPKNYLEVINRESLEWRRRNICLMMPYLFSLVKTVKYWQSRKDIDDRWSHSLITNGQIGYHWLYYKYINENFNNNNHSLEASETGKKYIQRWAQDLGISVENCLVITLREYSVDTIRNNDLEELKKIIEAVKKDFDAVVLVRDTDKGELDNYFKGYPTCDIASVNIELRAAIYEMAKLNIAISSGPASLLQLNKNTRFIVSKFIHESVAPAQKDFMIMKGFDITKPPSFLNNNQKWVWEQDSYENLIKAYKGITWA